MGKNVSNRRAGGLARAKALSPEARSAIAAKAARARWDKGSMPDRIQRASRLSEDELRDQIRIALTVLSKRAYGAPGDWHYAWNRLRHELDAIPVGIGGKP